MNYGDLQELFGEPVTTSATGKPQRQSEAPVAMTIVTAEDIRRSGADNLPDILRRTVGLDVQRIGPRSVELGIRGFSQGANPRILLLLNGQEFYQGDFGRVLWDILPVQLAEIRQIEIVRGPNTALFGFNATSGVINIVTYSPVHDDVGEVAGRVGNLNFVSAIGVATIPLSNIGGVRLSGQISNLDDFATPRLPFQQVLDPEQRQFLADANLRLFDKIDVAATYSFSTLAHTVQPPFSNEATDFEDPKTFETVRLKLSTEIGPGVLSIDAYRNEEIWDLFVAASSVGAPGVATTVLKTDYLFKPGSRHSVRMAGEYRRIRIESLFNEPGAAYFNVFSTSGMWEWRTTDRLTFTNAVRVDVATRRRVNTLELPPTYFFQTEDYNQERTSVTFNSGLVYDLGRIGRLRLSAARGIKAPTASNFNFDGFAIGVVGFTNPLIKDEVLSSYEIGLANDRFFGGSVSASAFFIDVKNLTSVISAPPTATSGPVIFVSNIGDASAYGLELAYKRNWDYGAVAELNYRIQEANDRFDFAFALPSFAYTEDSTPRHTLNARAGYERGAFTADLFLRYQSGIALQADPRISGRFGAVDVGDVVNLDGRLAYRLLDNVELSISAINAQSSEYRDTLIVPAERRYFGTLAVTF